MLRKTFQGGDFRECERLLRVMMGVREPERIRVSVLYRDLLGHVEAPVVALYLVYD